MPSCIGFAVQDVQAPAFTTFAIPSTLLAGRYADRATGARPVVGQRSPHGFAERKLPAECSHLAVIRLSNKGAKVNPALSRRLTGG